MIAPELVPDAPANIRFADETRPALRPIMSYRFYGKGCETIEDYARHLTDEAKIFDAMLGGEHWTLHDLSEKTGIPEGSVGSQIRNLRLVDHGSHQTPGRRIPGTNLWEYRLIPNPEGVRPMPEDPRAFEKGVRRAAAREGVVGVHDRRSS